LKRILITPLNWGLGHATRCMPIINECLAQGAEVIIGSDGRALNLLQKEYPQLTFIELPAYNITYQSNNMMLNIAPQLFKIFRAIWAESRAIQQIIQEHQIDIIISDNRYGCRSNQVHSIFMTHQLNIKIPNRLLEKTVAFFNQILIKRFDECWIPDFKNEKNSLSGVLGHRSSLKKLTYLGALTRMKYQESKIKNDILIILSGPEPQRTYLEEQLLAQVQNISQSVIFVKGKTDLKDEVIQKNNLTIYNYMTAHQLNQTILESEIVITRSGYSTILDLAVLGKKAILIPTPGQTEQEYLGEYFHEKGIFYYQKQKDFDLETALKAVQDFKGLKVDDDDIVKKVIKKLLR
jgi:uncharacterized protein (TIGR00661 family)